MDDGGDKEHHYLWAWYIGLILLCAAIIWSTIESPKDAFGWHHILFYTILIGFTAVHVWVYLNWKKVGHLLSVLYYLAHAIVIGYLIIFIYIDIDGMVVASSEPGLTTSEWILLIISSMMPGILISAVMLIFFPRDARFERDDIRLPISWFDEKVRGVRAHVRPDEITDIYKRWTFRTTGTEGRIIKSPIYGSADKGGLGFRLREGRRFGFEFFSRTIEEEDIERSVGRTGFRKLYSDHARFTKEEWSGLRRDLSVWYRRQEVKVTAYLLAAIVFSFLSTIPLMFVDTTIFTLTFLPVMSIFWPLFSLVYFTEAYRGFFVKGTIKKMEQAGDPIPGWIEFKREMLVLRERR